jgi:protein arginine kinase
MYQISNQTTLGWSEEKIIQSLKNVTERILRLENQAYTNLTTQRVFLEDKVYRAYGILSNCRSIGVSEAMDLLSYMRLGVMSGVLKKPEVKIRIYQIMMEIQPGHLQRAQGSEMTKEECDYARAGHLRGIFG